MDINQAGNKVNINIIDRNTFYNSGTVKDLSQYIDYSSRTYEKLEVDDVVNFKYKEGKDFPNTAYKEVSLKEFGELNAVTDFDFKGADQDVQSIFTIYPPSFLDKLPLTETEPFTDLLIHNQFDKVEKAVNADFIIGFSRGQYNVRDHYFIQDGVDINNVPTFISHDVLSNFSFSYNGNALSYSIENNAFEARPYVNTNYAAFFADWLAMMYDPDARQVKVTGYVPIGDIEAIRLNDIIVINGLRHIIKTLSYNWISTKLTAVLMKVDIEAKANKPTVVDVLGDVTFENSPTQADKRT